MRRGLVDQFSLIVYPVVLGRGTRLFPDDARATLRLIASTALNDGLMLLRYETV